MQKFTTDRIYSHGSDVFCVCVSLCKRVSTLSRDLLSLTVKMCGKWRKHYKKTVIDSDDRRFTAVYFRQFLFYSKFTHRIQNTLIWIHTANFLYKTILSFFNTVLSDGIPRLQSVSHGDSAAVATGQVLSQSYTGSLICLFHWGNKGGAQEDGEINVFSLLQVHYSALFNPLLLLLSFLHLSSPQQVCRVSSSLSMLELSRNQSEQSCAQLLLTSLFYPTLLQLPSFGSDTFCLSSCCLCCCLFTE